MIWDYIWLYCHYSPNLQKIKTKPFDLYEMQNGLIETFSEWAFEADDMKAAWKYHLLWKLDTHSLYSTSK